MTYLLTASLDAIRNTKFLGDNKGFVTELIVSRDISGRMTYNSLKYFHYREEVAAVVGETYQFEIYLNGRKVDKNGTEQVYNELKVKNFKEVQ